MQSVRKFSKSLPARRLALAAWLLTIFFPAELLGESLTRRVSLEAGELNHFISVPVGASVTIQNNYPHILYQTSVHKDRSDKKVLSLDSFPSGQSFGLEFSQKGLYSVCYSLKPESVSAGQKCLQINVVPLQTA